MRCTISSQSDITAAGDIIAQHMPAHHLRSAAFCRIFPLLLKKYIKRFIVAGGRAHLHTYARRALAYTRYYTKYAFYILYNA